MAVQFQQLTFSFGNRSNSPEKEESLEIQRYYTRLKDYPTPTIIELVKEKKFVLLGRLLEEAVKRLSEVRLIDLLKEIFSHFAQVITSSRYEINEEERKALENLVASNSSLFLQVYKEIWEPELNTKTMCLSAITKSLNKNDRKEAIKTMVKNRYKGNLFFLIDELPQKARVEILTEHLEAILDKIHMSFRDFEKLYPVEVGKNFIYEISPEKVAKIIKTINHFVTENKPVSKIPIFKFKLDEIEEQLAICALTATDLHEIIKCKEFLENFDIYNRYYDFSYCVYKSLYDLWVSIDTIKEIYTADYIPYYYKKIIITMLISREEMTTIKIATYLREKKVNEQEFKNVLEILVSKMNKYIEKKHIENTR